jgi:precorrin-8X/cobalt-precorrin-8 methylmutase
MSGPQIEQRSFAMIDEALPDRCGFSLDEWEIVRRMIHTTGDTGLAPAIKFSPDAIASGVAALNSCAAIYADSNMIRSGLSLARLRDAHPGYAAASITCCVADNDVAADATRSGLPRSLFAIRKARPMLDGAIATFGNAPVALLELNRMVAEEGLRPALVLAMPVGFVHVIESKEELMSLGVPFVAVAGRRGGSTLAVAALHALSTLAARRNSSGNHNPSRKGGDTRVESEGRQ